MALLETDPLDLRLDADGDLYIGPNGPELIGGIEGVTQLAVIQLRLFLGEWFANLEEGLPWMQEILGEKFDEELESLIRKLVTHRMTRKVPGVTALLALVVKFDGSPRALSISLGLRTVFGDTPDDAIAASIGGS